ncbi:TPA: hypothetical protein RQK14_003650 [Vibrio vulnificus]|nr:hypothetical protein [Vibrio vulnificus]
MSEKDIEKNNILTEPEEAVSGPEDIQKQRSKKNRNMLFLFLFCLLVGGGGAVYLTMPKETTSEEASSDLDRRLEKSAGQKVHPSLAGRRNYGEDYAQKVEGEVDGIAKNVSQTQNTLGSTRKELNTLEQNFATFLEQYERDKEERRQRDADLKVALEAQAQAQTDIQNQLTGKAGFPQPVTPIGTSTQQSSIGNNGRSNVPRTPPPPPPPPKDVERSEFQLQPISKSRAVNHRNSSQFIPAGAYAPGRIIIGAKTSAAVDAQSDPRPITIRLRGLAKGPRFNGQHTETDLDGCTVTAQAYGDISSEQGHAKLNEMSCATGPNEFKTVKVYGYIAHKGSYGVHSEVIMREGDLAQRAFWAGMLANTGESFGLLVGEESKSAVGTVKTAGGAKDAALNLFTGGLEQSSAQLSSYYIKRLEQIQSIIPLKAGTPVDVVFMKEVSLDTIEAQTAPTSAERQRIPLDGNNSDVAPNTINQQVLNLLQSRMNDAPNKTNWNNEFY